MNADAIVKRQRSRGLLCKKLSDKEVLQTFAGNVAKAFAGYNITKIAAPEAMGFALASAVAVRLECGLVLMTKGRPAECETYDSISFQDDYSGVGKSLFLRIDTVNKGDSVLLVDDYVERGTQVRASCSLLSRQGTKVVGIACLGTNTDYKHDDLPKIEVIPV